MTVWHIPALYTPYRGKYGAYTVMAYIQYLEIPCTVWANNPTYLADHLVFYFIICKDLQLLGLR